MTSTNASPHHQIDLYQAWSMGADRRSAQTSTYGATKLEAMTSQGVQGEGGNREGFANVTLKSFWRKFLSATWRIIQGLGSVVRMITPVYK